MKVLGPEQAYAPVVNNDVLSPSDSVDRLDHDSCGPEVEDTDH